MVDARLPAEWLGSLKYDALSDRAFRVLAGALMWCNAQGTDGVIPARYIRYLHPDGDDLGAFKELEAAKIWTHNEDGYVLEGWTGELHQSSASDVERYREGARRRQKAYRDRLRDESGNPAGSAARMPRAIRDVTHNVPREVTPNVGSGSLGGSAEESAYVTRHVDSPFCSRHPHGTAQPCGGCARARVAFENRSTPRPRGWNCDIDGHKFVTDGSCAVCLLRPRSNSVA